MKYLSKGNTNILFLQNKLRPEVSGTNSDMYVCVDHKFYAVVNSSRIFICSIQDKIEPICKT